MTTKKGAKAGLVPTLAAFQAGRAATMDPSALAENIRFRAALEATTDRRRIVAAGDKAPDFTLHSVEGPLLSRDALLADGPVVLIFFRFAGCPVCNVALPWYDRNLRPELDRRGVRLIAVSPQVPAKLGEIRSRHALGFTVATDPDNDLARRLGLTFAPDATARAFAEARGANTAEITGASTWELPMPAAILIDTDGTIRFAEASPDWLVRTEADVILAAVDAAIPLRQGA